MCFCRLYLLVSIRARTLVMTQFTVHMSFLDKYTICDLKKSNISETILLKGQKYTDFIGCGFMLVHYVTLIPKWICFLTETYVACTDVSPSQFECTAPNLPQENPDELHYWWSEVFITITPSACSSKVSLFVHLMCPSLTWSKPLDETSIDL